MNRAVLKVPVEHGGALQLGNDVTRERVENMCPPSCKQRKVLPVGDKCALEPRHEEIIVSSRMTRSGEGVQ